MNFNKKINQIQDYKTYSENPQLGFSETIYLSSLALLKITRHAQSGIPIEVMGMMIGKVLDDFFIKIIDVFAMPQTGTSVSVEAVDPIFQTKMLDMLYLIEKRQIITGWYHSHPGLGCWLSGTDINTQKSFEQLNDRSVALVIDPIQSNVNNIIIETFRLQSLSGPKSESKRISSIETIVRNRPFEKDEYGLNKTYFILDILLRQNLMEERFFSTIFEKDWTINFLTFSYMDFLNTKLLFFLSGIIKSFKKLVYSQEIFSIDWSFKNIEKINFLKNRIQTLFKSLVQESISFYLGEIWTE